MNVNDVWQGVPVKIVKINHIYTQSLKRSGALLFNMFWGSIDGINNRIESKLGSEEDLISLASPLEP
jgi:hypothetical protein